LRRLYEASPNVAIRNYSVGTSEFLSGLRI